MQVPDRVERTVVANFRTDVWTAPDGGRLVWSGMSNTTDGIDTKVIKFQTDKIILPELVKAGVLPPNLGK